MRKAIILVAAMFALSSPAAAAEAVKLPEQDWSFEGIFGTYDRAAAQRGLQVYKEVCAVCHGLRMVYYRNIADLGYDEEQVKAFAAEFEVEDGPNDQGEMFTRPGRPSDRFVSPFPNEQAARAANGGAYPPDLSLMTKARVGGPDYLHALLVGYRDQPPADFLERYRAENNGEEFTLLEGMYFNEYFPGHQIAMPPPLVEGGVSYSDGTTATVNQMAHDLTVFLAWAAEPKMEVRKETGVKVILFLIVFTGLTIAVKRKVWDDVH